MGPEEESSSQKGDSENKYKFALLQVDKRLVNLEIAVGEINEKVGGLKSFDQETLDEIKERIDDLEDLSMVENLGGTELKKTLEDINSKTNELSQKTDLLSGEMKKIQIPAPQTEQIASLKDEITRMGEEIEPLETSLLKKIDERVSEISLPTDKIVNFEKEIAGVKERITKLALKTENLALKTEEMAAAGPLAEVQPAVERRISSLEEKVGELPNEIYENFQKAIKSESKEISRLAEKIDDFESEFANLKEKTRPLGNVKDEMKQLESSILKRVNDKITGISLLSEQMVKLGNEIAGIEDRIKSSVDIEERIRPLQEEVSRLKEKTSPMGTEVIQRVVSEVADLRTETSREIKEIKDRISGISVTKSDIDIKFLSSRLNSLKESVDYLINRKAEIDMKLENFQKAMAQFVLKTEQIVAAKPAAEVPSSVNRRLSALEEKVEELPNEIFENFQKAMSQAASKPEQTGGEKAKKSFGGLDVEINELLAKIDFLENRLKTLEKEKMKSGKGEPVIV